MDISTVISIGSLVLAIISLWFSYKNYQNNNRKIIVDIDPNLYVLDVKKHLHARNDFDFSILESKFAIFLTITFVNYSTSNKSFLDLRAFDPETNANHFIATQRSLPFVGNESILISPFGDDGVEHFFITLPKRTFGAVNAGACNAIDVLVFLNEAVSIDNGVMISVKTSEKSRFNQSIWSNTHRKIFKHHSRLFCIKDSPLFKNRK